MNTNPLNGRRVKHGQLKDDDKGKKKVGYVFCCTNDERFIYFSLSLLTTYKGVKLTNTKNQRKSITRRLSDAFLSTFQSSSSPVSENTVTKDDRSEDSENEEDASRFAFLRLPKTEKDTTTAYPRYPRPLRTELFPNVTYMKVRTTTSKSIGNVVIRSNRGEKYEIFPRDSISTQRARNIYNTFYTCCSDSSCVIDLDSHTRAYVFYVQHSLMVLTDESNYANVRIQLRRLRKKNMFGVPLSFLFKEIFPSSSIKKTTKIGTENSFETSRCGNSIRWK